MSVTSSRIDRPLHALRDRDELARRLAGRRPAVFLDYDGTPTPIVERPEDAHRARARARPGDHPL